MTDRYTVDFWRRVRGQKCIRSEWSQIGTFEGISAQFVIFVVVSDHNSSTWFGSICYSGLVGIMTERIYINILYYCSHGSSSSTIKFGLRLSVLLFHQLVGQCLLWRLLQHQQIYDYSKIKSRQNHKRYILILSSFFLYPALFVCSMKLNQIQLNIINWFVKSVLSISTFSDQFIYVIAWV